LWVISIFSGGRPILRVWAKTNLHKNGLLKFIQAVEDPAVALFKGQSVEGYADEAAIMPRATGEDSGDGLERVLVSKQYKPSSVPARITAWCPAR
jgi:hypothetical protein